MNGKFIFFLSLLFIFYFIPFYLQGASQTLPMEEYNGILKLMGDKQYNEAVPALKLLIKKDPGFYRAYKQMARIYKIQKKLPTLLSYFESLKNEKPEFFGYYFALAQVYQSMNQAPQAVALFKQCIKLKPDFTPAYIDMLNCCTLLKDRDCLTASEPYLKSLLKNNPRNASVYIALGNFYLKVRHLDEARKMLNQALKLNPNLIEIYSSISTLHYFKGEFNQVIRYLKKVMPYAIKTKDLNLQRSTLGNIGIIYRRLGKYHKALKYNQKALDICLKTGDKPSKSRHLLNLGNIHFSLSNFEEALIYYRDALKICLEVGNRRNEGKIYLNIVNIYSSLGEYPKALRYANKALEISKQEARVQDVGALLGNIGAIYRKMKNLPEALKYFEEAHKFDKKVDNKYLYALNLANLSSVLLKMEKYEKAREYLKQALEINRKTGSKKNEAFILQTFGELNFELKNYQRSKKYYKDNLKIGREINHPVSILDSLMGLARVNYQLEEYQECLFCIREAIDLIETNRGKFKVDDLKTAFMAGKMEYFERIINILYKIHQKFPQRNHHREIVYYIQKAKARAFLDNLYDANINLTEHVPVELKRTEKSISRKISTLQTRLLDHHLTTPQRDEIDRKLKLQEKKYQDIILQIQRTSHHYAHISPYGLKDIQKALLRKGQAIAEYFVSGQEIFLLFITPKKFFLHCIENSEVITERIDNYLDLISQPNSNKNLINKAGQKLFLELFGPVKRQLHRVKHLVIAPDGNLHYFPFEALIRQINGGKPRYLLETMNISYTPSASAFLNLKSRKRQELPPINILAFADPVYNSQLNSSMNPEERKFSLENGFVFDRLPYSSNEVEGITHFFPDEKNKIYTRQHATEDIIKKTDLSQFKIIHFATHGYFNHHRPFRSSLVLTLDDNPREDGFLQVQEIYKIKLNADLVVLSACNTAKGRLIKGEGVTGMYRAFLQRGARSVLMSLWNINDKATALLMQHFYKSLSDGNSKTQALRQAKLTMLSQDYPSPFYWAPFILTGDTGAIIQ